MEHAIAVALGSVHARTASFPPDHSAEIVAFPRSFARKDATPLDRLQRAADKLQEAAQAQIDAVAGWRSALGDAAHSLEALETSMLRYERRLSALDLSEIAAKSRELATIMDKALIVKG